MEYYVLCLVWFLDLVVFVFGVHLRSSPEIDPEMEMSVQVIEHC